jgi:hypothetical protein
MKEFKIEFACTERISYSVVVEAETPEEAIKLFKDEPGNYDQDMGELIDSDTEPDTIEVVGHYSERLNGGCSLTRYDEPIKLKE